MNPHRNIHLTSSHDTYMLFTPFLSGAEPLSCIHIPVTESTPCFYVEESRDLIAEITM